VIDSLPDPDRTKIYKGNAESLLARGWSGAKA
jgi:hypothetical protein